MHALKDPLHDHGRQLVDRSLGLTPQQLGVLLDELDEINGKGRATRRHQRVRYRVACPLVVVQPGGGRTVVFTATRNISTGGLALLHPGFLHSHSHVVVDLRALDGEEVRIPGVVAHCRLVRGNIHEVGIQFDEAVNVRLFVPDLPTDFVSVETVDPATLHGRIMVYFPYGIEVELIKVAMRDTKVEITTVPDAEEGAAAVRKGIDAVILDGDAGAAAVEPVLAALRGLDPKPTLFVVTGDAAGWANQADRPILLPKPLDDQFLLRAIAAHLKVAAGSNIATIGAAGSAAEVCTLEKDDPRRALAATFASDAKQIAAGLRTASQAGEASAVKTFCMRLRGIAPALGFPELGTGAGFLLERLDQNGPKDEQTATIIESLAAACERIKVE